MKTSIKSLVMMLFMMLCLSASSSAFAQIPSTMTYNGFLMSNGAPATNPANVAFEIFDAENGGNSLWQQNSNTYDIHDGRFSAQLNGLNNDQLFNGAARWLQVTVDGERLEPRTQISSMPYAFKAGDAQTVGGKTAAQLGGGGGGGTDTLASLNCNNGQIAFYSAGNWACTPMPSYSGNNFATSGQNCPAGQIVNGIGADGKVTCAADKDTNTTYSGANFATSSQTCPVGQIVTGIDASGKVTCDTDKNTIYSGTNFATSNQACTGSQVVKGISASGALTCAASPDTTYTAGENLFLSGTEFRVNSSPTFTGNVKANNFLYSTPRKVTVIIPNYEFKTTGTSGGLIWKEYNSLSRLENGSANSVWEGLAPLHLPLGANVKKLGCAVTDKSSDHEIQVYSLRVFSRSKDGGFYSAHSGVVGGTSGKTFSSDTAKLIEDNISFSLSSERAYLMSVGLKFPQGTHIALGFYNCYLEYEISAPTY